MAFSLPTTNHATPANSTPSILSPPSSAHSLASPVPSILNRSTPNSPSPPSQDAPTTSQRSDSSPSPNPNLHHDVDPQIIEALKSKDRIYVLKLGEQMEKLINERRPHRLELQPSTTYQRLLVHRCSAYYKLTPESDPTNKSIIFVHHTIESKIPTRRICELVPAESTAQPAFKIMRRSPSDRRKPLSQAGSVAGEDADLSDIDQPSEAGSLGGRSNATGGSNKRRLARTIEEREAAYNEARSRIFMDFEEKEKEKDASASSSSVVSGSASTNGGSVGDIDDTGSSPATESEWSGPVTRDKNRRGGSGPSSIRRGGPYGNGSGSSRNSRAPSPSSFTYASLYEPPPSAPALYDPTQPQGNTGYHPPQYMYPYPHGPNPPYVAPYPYYPYHGFHSPPVQSTSDPSTPANAEPYAPQTPMQYGTPYPWQPPQAQPPLQSPPQMPGHPLPHQNSTPIMTSPTGTRSHQYPPQHYMPSHAYTYPPPLPYYPPPGQHMPPPPPPNMGSPMYEPRGANGTISPNNYMHSRPTYADGVPNQINGSGRGPNRAGPGSVNGLKGHVATMPTPARASWSYGPGIGGGYNNGTVNGMVGAGDAIGPRLSSNNRRTSQNSRASSNCDDVSSTASSSTASSSSRRTYTSTASSQHPLPPRPDWAVGIKAQPTLTGRHHDGTPRNISVVPSSRNINGSSIGQGQMQPPASLQSVDFPPLSQSSAAEKRAPVIAGAWGNMSSTRSILQANSNTAGNALVSPNGNPRLEEPDKGFERPPPKSAQLFNPKAASKPATVSGTTIPATNGKVELENDQERARNDAVADAVLADGVAQMSLETKSSEAEAALIPS